MGVLYITLLNDIHHKVKYHAGASKLSDELCTQEEEEEEEEEQEEEEDEEEAESEAKSEAEAEEAEGEE